MAPLDDMSGDRVLAEFEAMIRGTGGFGSGRDKEDEANGGLVPERRAVNWVNALAALAREIGERQGPNRAQLLLRSVGARMSRELLSPLPTVRDEFEPAINRALSILDWGWVAVLDRQDTIVFEHRTPWPFEKRLDHLPFVLEGFYTDTLHRLADNVRMNVRLTGSRGGALVFKWLPADASEQTAKGPAPSVIVPAAPGAAAMAPAALEPASEPMTEESPDLSDEEFDLASLLEEVAAESPPTAPRAENRRLPPLTETRRPREELAPRMPVMPEIVPTRAPLGAAKVFLVAATVFIVLFVLGVSSSGDFMKRVDRLVTANAAPRPTVSDLQARATNGDTDAQIRLGLQLANGGVDAKPNYIGAARWFEAAAKSGSLEAQYDLGVLTTDGLGVKRDPVGAAILFMNAAAGGFPQAEYRIGLAYQNGMGVPRSVTFAAMWFERAARHGVHQAQFALAGLYAAGDGVAADPVQAFAWYRLAEEEGDRAATAKRIELYRGMTTEQRQAAMNQAKTLIGDVSGTAELAPRPSHPTVDRLIAEVS